MVLLFGRHWTLIGAMRESPRALVKDLRRFERIALEQAERCLLPKARAAFLVMAGNYRDEAADLERGFLLAKSESDRR
jgi:hypothetical protein